MSTPALASRGGCCCSRLWAALTLWRPAELSDSGLASTELQDSGQAASSSPEASAAHPGRRRSRRKRAPANHASDAEQLELQLRADPASDADAPGNDSVRPQPVLAA